MKLGVDFGTCNSVVAVWNEERDQSELVDIEGNNSMRIPSSISISQNDPKERYFGTASRQLMGNGRYHHFQYFKMLLNVDSDKWSAFGWPGSDEHSALTPIDITRIFLEHLLLRTCEIYNDNIANVEQLVVSAPAIWTQRPQDNLGRERLRDICIAIMKQEIRVPQNLESRICIISEPHAAACYFAANYERIQGEHYEGSVFVCDYGGGTLDLSLCRVSEGEVTVQDSRGYGHFTENIWGAAGVAYDRAVIKRVMGEDIEQNPEEYSKLAREFEEYKITYLSNKINSSRIRNHLNSPRAADPELKPLWPDDDPDTPQEECIKASDAVEAFRDVIEPQFRSNVTEMLDALVRKGVIAENNGGRFDANPEEFRVLFVGGFSNLHLVEVSVARYLGHQIIANITNIPLLDSLYPKSERKPSVARGAAIVASERIAAPISCPVEIGLIGFVGDERRPCSLINAGQTIENSLENPDNLLPVSTQGVPELASVTLYIRNNDGIATNIPIKGATVRDLFPNTDMEGNVWDIGMLIDRNLIITLWIRDRINSDTCRYDLGDLIHRHSGIVLEPQIENSSQIEENAECKNK